MEKLESTLLYYNRYIENVFTLVWGKVDNDRKIYDLYLNLNILISIHGYKGHSYDVWEDQEVKVFFDLLNKSNKRTTVLQTMKKK